ncbi:hypothetical protein ABZ816_13290 [Actinosynnema sp. NPDC047251]|uniref:Uncharacterized protein n=1 Tax=Saccharothrix espanaensis (strain ATCC 51144 / DSM 44229 / JCM 9112 / NBRC 15066 / NRRL 15764) TaxID=1179773 RepID=K0K5M3_SACES|nr:hypothetical protein [Saccharothrix espanaensis]CCH35570.1 hypothetical protein BN6_83540 [Saccharothrix espanaensis DSM 44229]
MTEPAIVPAADRRAARDLLPARDLTRPGPAPLSLAEAAAKIDAEYRAALKLLGEI